jgi:hypothetical protein
MALVSALRKGELEGYAPSISLRDILARMKGLGQDEDFDVIGQRGLRDGLNGLIQRYLA